MKQNTVKSKQISYRLRPEVAEFLESYAARTHRSIQGMLDTIMDRVIDKEEKGESIIQ
ncbi:MULTISPECIES: hypothetical protein [Providencia]|uniref:hypothetical protein n=1 Tax=Providencia TaxID=586 RepID=UPI001EE6C155|nr:MULTISPECIES: hypothetical protein [Providencia]EJD6614063.1 hypothetical protein [Providencia rettgeri]ELM3939636.1 hypothetical protein [Providencia rettgeri]ELR5222917.1 hypothetical protein [Providencia rettgeri]EMA4647228.1 hypothetical protein [Providencia rettgeri]MBZ3683936.1 hypothetical protein [Providencia rettgeri]